MLPPASALTYCLLYFLPGPGPSRVLQWGAVQGLETVHAMGNEGYISSWEFEDKNENDSEILLPAMCAQTSDVHGSSQHLSGPILYITSFHSLCVHALAPRYSHILLPFQNTLFSSTTHSCHLMDLPSSSRTSALLLDEAS